VRRRNNPNLNRENLNEGRKKNRIENRGNKGLQGEMTRAVPVYRVDHGRKTKDPIGVVFEKRKTERAANYYDYNQRSN
jgi:hypothetical protein